MKSSRPKTVTSTSTRAADTQRFVGRQSLLSMFMEGSCGLKMSKEQFVSKQVLFPIIRTGRLFALKTPQIEVAAHAIRKPPWMKSQLLQKQTIALFIWTVLGSSTHLWQPNTPLDRMVREYDSISICLSKGLGGAYWFRARRIRHLHRTSPPLAQDVRRRHATGGDARSCGLARPRQSC